MRVVILSSELPPGPGGIGNHAHHVASQLSHHGWVVDMLAPQDYVSDAEVDAWSGEQSYRIQRLRHWPTALAQGMVWAGHARRCIRRRRPDLVIATGLRMVWLAAVLSTVTSVPFVAIGHGKEFGAKGLAGRLTRWAFGKAAAIICVSKYTQTRLQALRVPAPRLKVIPNGADDSVFRSAPSPGVADPAVGPTLITVGTVSDRKGQDLVIRALPRIVEAGFDVRYVAVGLAPTADDYVRLAERLGVDERVELTGSLPTPEVVRRLIGAALFVLPSRHTADGDFEGFGIAVVEAALCGTPAVVTRDSGLVEAIVDGETGLAVPPEDPEALADAIIALLGDEDRRRRMGERAQHRAVAEQTWERRGRCYVEYLSSLIESAEEL